MSFDAVGLRETRAWLAGRMKGLPEAARFAVASPVVLDMARAEATRIVDEVVYQTYEPEIYKRTMNLLNSVQAVALNENTGAVMIPFTPELAATGGPLKGAATYAQLMLPEYTKDTYWKAKPQASLPRDFLSAWLFEFKESSFAMLVSEVDLELAAR